MNLTLLLKAVCSFNNALLGLETNDFDYDGLISASEHESSISEDVESVVKPKRKLQDLPDEALIYISSFLPRKDLGYMSKTFYKLIFDRVLLAKVLAKRYDFPDFSKIQNGEGFDFLTDLSHVKEKEYLYKSLKAAMYDDRIFGNQMDIVIRYDLKLRPDVSYYRETDQLEDVRFFARKLIEVCDYEGMLVFIMKNMSVVEMPFENLNPSFGSNLIKRIMDLDPKVVRENEDLLELKRGSEILYRHFLNAFKDVSLVRFLVCSIVAGAPEKWYLNAILSLKHELKEELFSRILTKAPIFESPEDSLRIHDALARILRQMPKYESSRYYLLLNDVRFGDLDDMMEFIQKCDKNNLENSKIAELAKAAALAQKIHIVKWAHRFVESSELYTNECSDIHVAVSLLEGSSGQDRQERMNDVTFMDKFLKAYDVMKFNFDPSNKKNCFTLKLKPVFAGQFLPDTLQYNMIFTSEEAEDRFMTKMINEVMFNHSQHDETSVKATFDGLVEFESTRMLLGLFGISNPIAASDTVMKAVNENESIRGIVMHFGMKFRITDEINMANLLNNSIKNLQGILIQWAYTRLMSILKSTRQIRNYEEFSNSDCSTLMLQEFDRRSRTEEADFDAYYDYRVGFKYWLNGPNRQQITQLSRAFRWSIYLCPIENDFEDLEYCLRM